MNIKRGRLIISGALTLALTASCIIGARATEAKKAAVDLSQPMSLTVDINDGTKEFLAKLPEGSQTLVYDLYKIADAEDKGSGLTFKLTDTFSGLAGDFKTVSQPQSTEVSDYMAFAQKALGYLFGADGTPVGPLTDKSTLTGLEINKKVSPEPGPGMYLLVVRGTEEGSTTIKQYTVSSSNMDQQAAKEGLSTAVKFDGFTVTASPQIVCFPTNGELDTTKDGQWIYDQTLVLKLAVTSDTGSIRINKTLLGYNLGNENATFVFRVDVKKDGKLVSSEVYSAMFDKEGTKSIKVDGLPIGADVTVTEVYSGVAYKASVTSGTTTVAKDVVNEVSFTNTYDNWQGGGGGITNRFESTSQIDAGNEVKWELTNPAEGNVGTQNGRPQK